MAWSEDVLNEVMFCLRPVFSLLIVMSCVVLCACASKFDENYIAASTVTYPPKPKDFRAPIIGRYPDRPFTVIGSARFGSDHDLDFVESGLQWNARQHGADAVALAVDSQLVQTPYSYGGGTIYQSRPVLRTGNVNLFGEYGSATGRYTEVGTEYVPQTMPTFSGVKSEALHRIAANFIVYR